MNPVSPALLLVAVLAILGCEREDRDYRPPPPAGAEYEQNAWHVSEGKRLFNWFNCSGCHANGGGGMGPPLMDAEWIYGGSIEQIVSSVEEGRPNGMPAWRGRIPEQQIWQIAAYVRSMGGNLRKDVAPGRSDDMMPHPAENATEPQAQPTQ